MKIINKVFLILLVSLAASPMFAQSAIDTFVQKVDGAGSLTAAVQTADGGYVTSSRINDTSFLVRKIKDSGQKQWERRLNFQVTTRVSITGIAQTTDGGFALVGFWGCDDPYFFDHDCSADPSISATLVKLRPNGTVAWKKNFPVTGEIFSRFASVIAMPDGGVIAMGVTNHIFAVRFTATGDVVWKKNFGNPDPFFSYDFRYTVTSDNGFILATPTFLLKGNYVSPNGVDVMKINNSGTVVWEKSLKSDGFTFQSLGAANEGVILLGTSTKSSELKVVVLKADGTISWKAGYSLKVPSNRFFVSSPIQTPDGGYVVTVGTRFGKAMIVKIDSSRKVAFQNTFGNGLVSGESIVFVTPSGGFFLFASTASNILVSKLNSEGIVPGCNSFHPLGSTIRTSFGPLTNKINITNADDLSLEPIDFGLTSVVTNQPVSSVCQ